MRFRQKKDNRAVVFFCRADARIAAERTRFELVVRNDPYVGLANRWFQPLTHLSKLDPQWDFCIRSPQHASGTDGTDYKDTKDFLICNNQKLLFPTSLQGEGGAEPEVAAGVDGEQVAALAHLHRKVVPVEGAIHKIGSQRTVAVL